MNLFGSDYKREEFKKFLSECSYFLETIHIIEHFKANELRVYLNHFYIGNSIP